MRATMGKSLTRARKSVESIRAQWPRLILHSTAAIVTRFPVKDSRNRLIAVESAPKYASIAIAHNTVCHPVARGNIWLMIKGRWTERESWGVILAGQRFSSETLRFDFQPPSFPSPTHRKENREGRGEARDKPAMSENDRLLGLLLSGYATSTKTSRLSSLSTKPSVTPKYSCEGVETMCGRRRRYVSPCSPCSPCLRGHVSVWTLAVYTPICEIRSR